MGLFTRLFDDAALFPPAGMSLEDALPAYRAATTATAEGPHVGRFLCPASRIAELRTHLIPEDLFDLGLIADTGVEELPKALDAVHAEPRVRLAAVEIALPEEADQARAAAVTIGRLTAEVPTFIEVRRAPGRRDILDRLAAARAHGVPLGAKLRTGGLAADTFPAPSELADFIVACVERDLPFKCTAGLHHAVRHTDAATGLVHHGFLNVLAAVARAADGRAGAVLEILESTDAGRLAGLARATTEVERVRRFLTSIGTCDIDAPRADLADLGLVQPG
ncbi:hypothetical protein [Spirillospora sp. NPDC047279]|uniref:hypothetical protein n=1 Tax=Spirillospora sp. NPDC047279 TaxID=3155478 RepID=UPI0033C7A2B6